MSTPLRACLVLACLLPLAAACRPPVRGTVITVAGSTSVLPFVEYLAAEYMHLFPDVGVNVQGGGSSAGIQAVLTGAADLGMSSRPLGAAEAAELGALPIAWDAIAIIVHHTNPVTTLTLDQVRAVFSGTAGDWADVGGRQGRVTVVTREQGSGTRGAFEEMVMRGLDTTERALVQDSNGAVREIVAADPAAIGYLSLGLVDDRVRALTLDGRPPTVEAVLTGRYELVRPFLFVLGSSPRPEVEAFVEFVLGEQAQALLAQEGLIPAAAVRGGR